MLEVDRQIAIWMSRSLGGGGGEDDHGFGVHISYEDLYASMVFFLVIWVAGAFFSRLLMMPALVGQIFAGIVLGPNLSNFVPNPEAFVMLGEIGLILLVLEAGIDIDLTTLKLIGVRGMIIAIIGSILPIAIGIGVALAIGTDVKGSIAAGAAFGPTSVGIAMNILRTAKIINTPVGQLIVAAAVIDDMIALVILSQLGALVGTATVASVLVPIVSAVGFLLIGGYVAIYILPGLIDKIILSKVSDQHKGGVSLAIMLIELFILMPATYYSKASFLMGAFVAGLTFCSNHDAHHEFISQFKRVMQWLIRIFFAASIGFQVPVREFGSGKVIVRGLFFTLALTGKLAVGFLVPNFSQKKRFTGMHLRDCLIVGFSMAAEGEFAFVIAVFAVDSGVISKDLYAAVVLAVLLSTIFAPFLLRLTITHYAKKTEKQIENAQRLEMERKHLLSSGSATDLEQQLTEGIKNKTAVFLCIQIQSASSWGLIPKIMQEMNELKLDVIDHRSWNPRGVNTTLVSEIYAQDHIVFAGDDETVGAAEALEERMEVVRAGILSAIKQEDAKVKVSRWFPGVIEEIIEEHEEPSEITTTRKAKAVDSSNLSVTQSILNEASAALDKHKERQTHITKQRTVAEIAAGDVATTATTTATATTAAEGLVLKDAGLPTVTAAVSTPPRRRRVKTRSTPVVGGDMFASPATEPVHVPTATVSGDTAAQLTVGGKVYKVRVDAAAMRRVQNVKTIDTVPSLGTKDIRLPRRQRQVSYDSMLKGFVRKDEDDMWGMKKKRDSSLGGGGGDMDTIEE